MVVCKFLAYCEHDSMKTILYFFSLCLLVFGCQKTPEKKNTLKINFVVEPITLDSRKAVDVPSYHILKACFDGLVRTDSNSNVILSLAKSCNISEDQKTFTFELKEAYWSNGDRIVATDFVETWKTMLDPKFPSISAHYLYKIKNGEKRKLGQVTEDELGIEAIDSKTLVIELENPTPNFLTILSCSSFNPYPNRIAKYNESLSMRDMGKMICNGPFQLKKWSPKQEILLEKNESYFDKDNVKLGGVSISFIEDASTELALYESSALDFAGGSFSALPSDCMQSIKSRDDFYSELVAGVCFYSFNTGKYPVDNTNIRKALTFAMNRHDIINHTLQTSHEVATRYTSKLLLNNDEEHYFEDNQQELAVEYFEKGLQELGITRSEFPSLEISTSHAPIENKKVAEAIADQWKQVLGINTTIQTAEWKVYVDKLTSKQYTIGRMGLVSIYEDPLLFLEQYKDATSGFNFSGWKSKTFTASLEKTWAEKNPELRNQYLKETEKIFLDEMPIAPLFFYSFSYLKKPHVKNLSLNKTGIVDLKWVYLDPPRS